MCWWQTWFFMILGQRASFNFCCTATSNELDMTHLTKSNRQPSSRLNLLSKRTWCSTLGRRNLGIRPDLSQNEARSYHRTHDIEPVTMKGYWNSSEKSKLLRGIFANTATATDNSFLLRIVFGQSCFDLSSFYWRLTPGSLCPLSQAAGVQVKSSCLRKKVLTLRVGRSQSHCRDGAFHYHTGKSFASRDTYIFKNALHIFTLSVLRQSSASSCLTSANVYSFNDHEIMPRVVASCVEDKVRHKCLQRAVASTATEQLRDPSRTLFGECTADFFLPKHALVNSGCFCSAFELGERNEQHESFKDSRLLGASETVKIREI